MNLEELYNIKNFHSFNNIFTIYKKRIVTHKRVVDEDENGNIIGSHDELFFDKIKYIPVYGHYFNGNNQFICKRIYKKRILDKDELNDFIVIKDEDIVRPYKGGIYICKDIDDLYNTLSKLKKNNNDLLIV